MKKTQLFDILFIIICAVVFSLISFYGYSKLLSQFSVVVALIAYFVGKYVGRVELRKKMSEDKSQ
jgi:CDP-diglyceride synthetase